MPAARATSPSAAAMREGSPSSKAASRYAARDSGVSRCSATSQTDVSAGLILVRFFLMVDEDGFRCFDVGMLRSLVAASEEERDFSALSVEVDAVSRSVVDS